MVGSYYANVHNIPNELDSDLPLEEQAKEAFDLRNKYKRQAREAMSDRENAEKLERLHPVPTFEELLRHKMEDKGLSLEEAIRDIIRTASTTNTNVDDLFGLGGRKT